MISTSTPLLPFISHPPSSPAPTRCIQQRDAAFFFWAGFVVRPLGGWLFGFLADRYGRRGALITSVLLMCFGSLMIAVMPTYASIGVAAPLLLGLARIIQGVSLGGEYGTSATYLSEVADPKRRGFYSSFQYVTLIGGQLSAILVLLILQKLFLTEERDQGLGLAHPLRHRRAARDRRGGHAIATSRRRKLSRKPRKKTATTNSLKALLAHPREVLLVIGLTLGGTCAFYTFTIYMQPFLKLSVGLDADTTTLVVAGSLHLRDGPATDLRLRLGPYRAPARAHLVRRMRRRLHLRAPFGHPGDEERLRGLVPHLLCLDHRRRLHLDQRHREGRAVPDPHPRDGRRASLCAHRLALRRNRAADRASVQVDGSRKLVLLVPHRLASSISLVVYVLMRDTKLQFGDGAA